MKKFLALTLVVVMLFTFAACGGSDSIIGKWVFGANTYEFKEDNTVVANIATMEYTGTYEVQDDKIVLNVKGLIGEVKTELTYELKGKSLKLTGDVTLTNNPTSTTIEFAKQ